MLITYVDNMNKIPDFAATTRNGFMSRDIVLQTSGIFCDMDGTLINSTSAIIKHWERTYGLDACTILAESHGRRTIDVLQSLDPSKATWDHVCELERQIPLRYADGVEEIAGARQLIADLERLKARWTIVTSGTRPQVTGWLEVLKLPEPAFMITAEVVEYGKPNPECYTLAMKNLGLQCSADPRPLVLEDAPAGITAGKAAGCMVAALETTHQYQELCDAGADWVIPDLRSVHVEACETSNCSLSIRLSNVVLQ